MTVFAPYRINNSNYKKGRLRGVPFYEFPIGTISKVKRLLYVRDTKLRPYFELNYFYNMLLSIILNPYYLAPSGCKLSIR